ncbi:PAS domain S-box protein [Natrinema versiforme]|uniref:histidine kinase n=1 Tax=Natrinema versiforme TaxID=88724 RepID=A0A4P8WMN3_9EURY|nr:PAS domain S-box protein [Natrinema versiforme]QCS43553.1 PAS domain S-box protein [Natrinema versiforme]
MGTNSGPDTRAVVVGSDTGTVLERPLAERGVTTETVRTTDACLESLSAVDCVVIGDTLPDADPVDCCRAVRDRRSDIPIIAFPDDGSEALAGAVVAAGADGYVPRSQGHETLATRLNALLEERRADAETTTDTGTAADAAESGSPEPADDPSDRLELLVEQSPLAIIEWNLAFEVRNWNPAATELFGYTAEEAAGESAVDLIVPESERAAVHEYWNDLVSGSTDGQPSRQVNRNVRADGTPMTCEWFNTPLVEDGEVVSVLSFGQDITADRKRANALEALQATTQELLRAGSADEIADIVMAATEDVIDRALGAIRIYDEDSETLELAGVTSALDEHTDDISSISSADGVLWDVYTDDEPTLLEDVSRISYDIDLDVENALLHPLGDHGLLSVGAAGADELDDAEIHLLNALAATAEAALDRAARERELERTETVVETVGDCVYQLDPDGRFVTVNETMMGTTGYDRDDLLGEHVSTVLTDESVERGRRQVRDLVADDDRRVTTYEITLTGPDGERTPAEVNMSLLYSDGEIDGTVGIARDISDRKRMERKLVDRKSKIEGLHSVASRLDDCESRAAIYDVAVEAAEDVLDFDVCLVNSIRDDSFVTEAASAGLETDLEGRRPIGEGVAGQAYRTQRSIRVDGSAASDAVPEIDDCRSVLSVPIGDRGVFQAISAEPNSFTASDEELAELLLSHVTDALDRIAYEKRLRAERDRFAALFEHVPDAVVSVSRLADGPIVEDVNPAFERCFGYDESELVGTPIDQVIVPPDRKTDAERLNQLGSRGEVSETAVKRRTVDGLRDFRLRVVPMEMDRSSDRAFALYTDITAQKQRQKRLEILNRVLRHDLRNGMNIINGCAEMLADAVDDADREYVETIQCRTNELIGLAEKTRTVERVLDRDEVAAGPVDFSEAVEQAVSRLESAYDVDISCSLPDRAFARADEYLRTAVFQVLENAVEHTDRSRPTIDVTLRDPPDSELLTLSIADDGPGMPEEERELLEGDREITQLRHASGIGLWLVNWVVAQAGGELSFTDNEPRGTVVTLEVPRADAESIQSASDGTATGD